MLCYSIKKQLILIRLVATVGAMRFVVYHVTADVRLGEA
jgi:hypothetical protein